MGDLRIHSWILAAALMVFGNRMGAQVVTSEPAFPSEGDAVTVFFDAAEGTGGLKGYTGEVYAHTGVLTDSSRSSTDWRYVKTDWGVNTPETRMTRISGDTYSLEITPFVRDYYGVPASEKISHMAFVFRSSDSQREGKDTGGKDIFLEVYKEGLKVQFIQPSGSLLLSPNDGLSLEVAASLTSDIKLFLHENLIQTATGKSLLFDTVLSDPGDYLFRAKASSGEMTSADSIFIHVLGAQVEEDMPPGLADGINYRDEQTAHLVLFAPQKEHVFVIGEMNRWTPRSDARMKKDGDRFWITLENLHPGREYAFQYLVDGEVRIADPYTEKTLDPDDRWIDPETYPGLKPYPEGLTTGVTSILQTARDSYLWTHTGFDPPDPDNLVIYELLLRDFIAAHDWSTLTDSLAYFSRLGINAIELMPVNEFEGNESWGYNPSFYFAPDKYYGPADDLKAFIDSCHGRGIAVIIDMVLNHSYSQSPLVQLYFDGAAGKVSPDNPWYNVDSPNPVFFWGYDFDHGSQATRDFVDRVNRHWQEEFRVDGFRFDFTKGFTNTPGDGSAYDADRIGILKRMADRIRETNPDTYVILEHLASNQEEKELASYGMLLWGNLNFNYNEATMGYHESGKSDFSWISHLERGWDQPRLVGYMESHDEERLMFKNLSFGNSSGGYDIQELSAALQRMELAGAFFFPIPGPKMIWQFGEVGYDYSIDNPCRVCNKPIRWDYLEEEKRQKIYRVWSDLIRLKTTEPAFRSDDFHLEVAGPGKRIGIQHPDMDIRILGNFGVTRANLEPFFSRTGWWYDYFAADSFQVSNLNEPLPFDPGEYRIYTTKRLSLPSLIDPGEEPGSEELSIYPNPVTDILRLSASDGKARLLIYNASGQMVIQRELREEEDRIDVSALGRGLYLLHHLPSEGSPTVLKMIKY